MYNCWLTPDKNLFFVNSTISIHCGETRQVGKTKLLGYYSNVCFVSGHQPPLWLSPPLPGLQQQLQPEHAAQPRQGDGLLLLRVITSGYDIITRATIN